VVGERQQPDRLQAERNNLRRRLIRTVRRRDAHGAAGAGCHAKNFHGIERNMMSTFRRRPTIAAVTAALVVSGVAASVVTGTSAQAAGQLDNPYAGASVYVNPEWAANAVADGGSAIADQPTFVWMDHMAAITGDGGKMGLAAHLDDAIAKGNNLVQVVIYDLPNRDCAALASNGEIPSGGLVTYETKFIDPIVSILKTPKYANLRIVNVIEPDSLPNLVTNADQQATATDACRKAKSTGEYLQGVGYALAQLGALPNVYNYVDAGHHGWLGWDTNFQPFGQIAHQAATASGATVNDVAGFITNTANYSPLVEPNFKVTDAVNGTSVRQSKWVDWNYYVDEQSFAPALRDMLVSTAGFNPGLGMLIDTSRDGWGGTARPAGPGPMSSVDAYVNGGRVDRRPHAGDWCNQNGAGIGERPRVVGSGGVDAYVWVKPPGESDGDSHDQMCDPGYGGNAQNGNNPTNALPGAPRAGQWFSAEFRMLVQNAYPPIGSGPTPSGPTPSGPTSGPTPSATTSSPTPTPTASTGVKSCSATYAIQNDWGTGFTAGVTVRNTGTSAIGGWRVTWTFGGNQQITNSWSATVGQSGAAVTATNAGWNGSLGAGAGTQFGFQATNSGSNGTPTLTCAAS
jgi:cellulose 1,4-beta-cellobiosidase